MMRQGIAVWRTRRCSKSRLNTRHESDLAAGQRRPGQPLGRSAGTCRRWSVRVPIRGVNIVSGTLTYWRHVRARPGAHAGHQRVRLLRRRPRRLRHQPNLATAPRSSGWTPTAEEAATWSETGLRRIERAGSKPSRSSRFGVQGRVAVQVSPNRVSWVQVPATPFKKPSGFRPSSRTPFVCAPPTYRRRRRRYSAMAVRGTRMAFDTRTCRSSLRSHS
jgi:hypothetical protein